MYCQQLAVSTSATLRYLTDKHVAHAEQGQTCGLSKSGIKQFWQYKDMVTLLLEAWLKVFSVLLFPLDWFLPTSLFPKPLMK